MAELERLFFPLPRWQPARWGECRDLYTDAREHCSARAEALMLSSSVGRDFQLLEFTVLGTVTPAWRCVVLARRSYIARPQFVGSRAQRKRARRIFWSRELARMPGLFVGTIVGRSIERKG